VTPDLLAGVSKLALAVITFVVTLWLVRKLRRR
jgi:hypothetical protein